MSTLLLSQHSTEQYTNLKHYKLPKFEDVKKNMKQATHKHANIE